MFVFIGNHIESSKLDLMDSSVEGLLNTNMLSLHKTTAAIFPRLGVMTNSLTEQEMK